MSPRVELPPASLGALEILQAHYIKEGLRPENAVNLRTEEERLRKIVAPADVGRLAAFIVGLKAFCPRRRNR